MSEWAWTDGPATAVPGASPAAASPATPAVPAVEPISEPITAPLPRMEVHASFEALEPLRGAWDEFVAAHGSSGFHSFEHCRVWWRHYGAGRELRLLVFREAGEIVGILPMFADVRRLGPVAVRMAGILGSDSTTSVVEPPVRAESARAVFATALAHLLDTERCDAVRLAPIAGDWPHFDALRGAVADLEGTARIARDVPAGVHTVFDLPPAFDRWFASLDKRRRSDHRRAMKTLEEAHRVVLDVVDDRAALETELPRFRAMHEAQWQAEGRLGHFRDWPESDAYHTDLVRAYAAGGRAYLLRLLLDGEVVSYQLCYGFGTTLHWVLPARVLRPELQRFSLGRVGLVHTVEFAIGAGYRRVEGGPGRYDYKLQLGGTEHALRTLVVAAARPGTRSRLDVFARLAHGLDLVYYRAWFLRVAPRLGLPRGPLWTTWIRSRP